MLTQERLKEVLEYNPDMGVFIWIKPPGKRLKYGEVAEYLDARGYYAIGLDKKQYRAHRLVFLYMTGSFPRNEVDHINHNRADNRWANLRDVSRTENGKNQKLNSRNTSSVCGVDWRKDISKWRVRINPGILIGNFSEFADAVIARKEAEKQHGFHANHGN
mgnify:FL=1